MSLNTFMVRTSLLLALLISLFTIYFKIVVPDTHRLDIFLYQIQHDPVYASSEDIPDYVKNAFIASEDNYFLEHSGVDYVSLLNAVKILMMTGEKRIGGSTITMQLAKNLYLHNRKTFFRKFNEILIAFKIEQAFTKDEILVMYLNMVYLGHNSYGIKEAARFYFNKRVSELSISEATILAVSLPAPSRVTPLIEPETIMQKRDEILIRQLALKYIQPEAYYKAFKEPLNLYKK